MRSPSALLAAASLCAACGARTSLSDEATADAGAAVDVASTGVTLSIPLGVYSDCTSSTVTTRPHFIGATGHLGAVTLSQEGDGVVAALDFPTYARGRVTFTPTAANAAGLRGAQRFDVQTAGAGFSVVTVTAAAGALSLVDQTLFVSTRGAVDGDEVSTFVRCHVPAALPVARITTRSPPAGAPAAGDYRACATTFSSDGPTRAGLSGGNGALTVTATATTLRAAWSEALATETSCRSLDFGAPSVTAPLSAGQSCEVRDPCGPPPTLGPSPFPTSATWRALQGAMAVNGGVLFVNVVGDTSPEACGAHALSISCAGP